MNIQCTIQKTIVGTALAHGNFQAGKGHTEPHADWGLASMSAVRSALTPAASASALPQVQFAHAFFEGAHAAPACILTYGHYPAESNRHETGRETALQTYQEASPECPPAWGRSHGRTWASSLSPSKLCCRRLASKILDLLFKISWSTANSRYAA